MTAEAIKVIWAFFPSPSRSLESYNHTDCEAQRLAACTSACPVGLLSWTTKDEESKSSLMVSEVKEECFSFKSYPGWKHLSWKVNKMCFCSVNYPFFLILRNVFSRLRNYIISCNYNYKPFLINHGKISLFKLGIKHLTITWIFFPFYFWALS